MTVRVNPNLVPDLSAGLDLARQQLNMADLQLASGRSINAPSDNPSGTAASVLNHDAQNQTDTFQRNVTDLQSTLQIADSVLGSAVSAANQAISLGVEAGNSTLSNQNRQAIANQLVGIQKQLVAIANTSASGTYLFAGTLVESQPFTLNPAAAAGVNYNGNSAVTSVQIASGESVSINSPGNQIFMNPSGKSIPRGQSTDLGGANEFRDCCRKHGSRSSFERIQCAARILRHRPQSTAVHRCTFLSNEKVQLSTEETNIAGADIAKVASDFSQAQIAYNRRSPLRGKFSTFRIS